MALAVLRRGPAPRSHCPEDDWGFDPRYTDGVCPICGWRPEATEAAELSGLEKAVADVWAELAKVPWDLVALGLLFVVLVALGLFVAALAKINLLPR